MGATARRRFITDAAGRMLIGFDAGNCGEICHISGVRHGKRQFGGLLRSHALEADRHQKGGELIIRDGAAYGAGDNIVKFGAVECAAVFFLIDQFIHVHGKYLRFFYYRACDTKVRSICAEALESPTALKSSIFQYVYHSTVVGIVSTRGGSAADLRFAGKRRMITG